MSELDMVRMSVARNVNEFGLVGIHFFVLGLFNGLLLSAILA